MNDIGVLSNVHEKRSTTSDADVPRDDIERCIQKGSLRHSPGGFAIEGKPHQVELTAEGHDALRPHGLCHCPTGTGKHHIEVPPYAYAGKMWSGHPEDAAKGA